MITPVYVRESSPKLLNVQSKIDEIVKLFESKTGWLFSTRTNYIEYIKYYSFLTSRTISLNPLTSVSLVQEQIDGVWTTVDIDDYYLNGQQLIKQSGYWNYDLKVTCTGGYTTSTCPADIRLALKTQLLFLEGRLKEDILLVSQKSVGIGASSQFLNPTYHPLFESTVRRYYRYI